MHTFTTTREVNLALLHDQIIAAIPGFRRVHPNTHGEDTADEDNGRVSQKATVVSIRFADNIALADVEAVVDAHDSTQTQPDPRGVRLARIAELSALDRATWTADQRDELSQLLGLELTQ